jgi:tyrosyl-tRNA synthetase
VKLLKEAGLTESTSDSIRMIKAGAVKLDGEKILDKDHQVYPGTFVAQVGKRRFAEITVITSKK